MNAAYLPIPTNPRMEAPKRSTSIPVGDRFRNMRS